MAKVEMYSTASCPYCVRAEKLFEKKDIKYEKIRVDLEEDRLTEMLARSNGRKTVPQIFVNGHHVGGFDDLAALDRAGQLDTLLRGDPIA